jgi:CSLREA domain-containing protein/uncharacterized repeat protein (TIGR01451 family)
MLSRLTSAKRGRCTILAGLAAAVALIVAVPASSAATKSGHVAATQPAHVAPKAPKPPAPQTPPGIRDTHNQPGHLARHTTALSRTPKLAPRAAVARTYTVNSTGDSHDANPGDGVCADSTGACTLRAAIEEANADTGVTQINVPAGTITLTLGELNPTASMFITGAGASSTIVDQTTSSSRVFDVSSGSTEISGMTIEGGTANDGAGVYVQSASLTLASDTISANNASTTSDDGGGVYVDYYGALWLTNSNVLGNSAYIGGGLYVYGRAYLNGSTIGRSAAGQGNSATNGGGGVYVDDGNLAADNSTVEGNTGSYYAGGIYNYGSTELNGGSVTGNTVDAGVHNYAFGAGIYNDYSLSLTGTIVSNNLTRGYRAFGGGIYNGRDLQLTDVSVGGNETLNTGNDEFSGGGGIYNGDTLQMTGGSISNNISTFDNRVASGGLVWGAGFYTGGDNVALNGVSINGNAAYGGLYAVLGAGVAAYDYMTLENSTVNDNTSTGRYVYGGGFYNESDSALSGVTVNGNSAQAQTYLEGGGIASESPIQAQNVTIDANTAKVTGNGGELYGGGFYDDNASSLDNVWVTNTVAQAPNGYIVGGGLDQEVRTTMDHSGITGTKASADTFISGAGLYINYPFTITRTVIANNSGNVTSASGEAYGGGVYENDAASFINDTIANNSVTASGGGAADDGAMYISGDYAAQMTNDTVAGNTAATNSGGIFVDAKTVLNVKNTIMSANVSPAAGNCSGPGTINSAGHNLENIDTCGFHNAGDLVNTDPKLGPLQDNGGGTLTMAELPGSPAIDAGSNNGCPATDQRGVPRPQGAACDIGAFEVAAAGLSATNSATNAAVTNTPFTYTITVKNGGPGPSTGTTVVDQLPAGETLYGANPSQGSCSSSGSPAKVTCNLGDLENGSSATLVLVVSEAHTGSVTDTAAVTNAEGSSVNATATTTVYPATLPGKRPKAITGGHKHVTKHSAKLLGKVLTGGQTTWYFFQYGKSKRLGLVTKIFRATSSKKVAAEIRHLLAGKKYFYRLVALNSSGRSYGKEHHFTTKK